MRLFVGLGNPGAKYASNRHNIGFMAVDEIARRHGFAPWRRRFQGETSEGNLGNGRVILLKPTTYMNESGNAVGEATKFFKMSVGDITVFHDEIELPPAKLRVKIGGGIAGDFPICVVPMLHQDLRRTSVPLWGYFCQISDSTTSYGSYSGAVPNEKITWGKLGIKTPKYIIESDATIVAPLVFGWLLGW